MFEMLLDFSRFLTRPCAQDEFKTKGFRLPVMGHIRGHGLDLVTPGCLTEAERDLHGV